ncbi:cytochrome c oxidase subunit 5A, mitochondrial [Leptopilina heterotoma]|uniref:cytochrome c oxidase subunit 5A, mitochondrial n=1 Tax=Leptopilina heterotoma TaxID=63436 RepID=UPI001CA8205B|nr:cytochrome c oxidase subunit 5A, mitochondrial [Leptopilina heterotoma]
MLRIVAGRIVAASRQAIQPRVMTVRSSSHGKQQTDEEVDAEFIQYFDRKDIDHWELRSAMNRLAGLDMVPDPAIIIAGLKACRRLNDFAVAVRFLEMVKMKCGDKLDKIYPYVLQEIRPTLDELGINTPEELGYDKPELALENVYEIH